MTKTALYKKESRARTGRPRSPHTFIIGRHRTKETHTSGEVHAREEGREARVGRVGLLEDALSVAADGDADARVQARLRVQRKGRKGMSERSRVDWSGRACARARVPRPPLAPSASRGCCRARRFARRRAAGR